MALELGRRLVHASGAIVPGAYLLDARVLEAGIITWSFVRAFTAVGLVVTFTLEIARLHGDLEHAIYDRLTRPYEEDTVAGYALYAVGWTITVFAFDPQLAVPSLLMLALGDPVSGLLSSGGLRTIARPRVLAGMFVVCFLIATPFVPPVVALGGALGATVADGVKPTIFGRVIDDNLTIPTVAAGTMWVLIQLI